MDNAEFEQAVDEWLRKFARDLERPDEERTCGLDGHNLKVGLKSTGRPHPVVTDDLR